MDRHSLFARKGDEDDEDDQHLTDAPISPTTSSSNNNNNIKSSTTEPISTDDEFLVDSHRHSAGFKLVRNYSDDEEDDFDDEEVVFRRDEVWLTRKSNSSISSSVVSGTLSSSSATLSNITAASSASSSSTAPTTDTKSQPQSLDYTSFSQNGTDLYQSMDPREHAAAAAADIPNLYRNGVARETAADKTDAETPAPNPILSFGLKLASHPEFATQPKPLPPLVSAPPTPPLPSVTSTLPATNFDVTPKSPTMSSLLESTEELSLDEQFHRELAKVERRMESSSTAFMSMLEGDYATLEKSDMSLFLDNVYQPSENTQPYSKFLPAYAPSFSAGSMTDEMLDSMILNYANNALRDADLEIEECEKLRVPASVLESSKHQQPLTTSNEASPTSSSDEGDGAQRDTYDHSHYIDIPDDTYDDEYDSDYMNESESIRDYHSMHVGGSTADNFASDNSDDQYVSQSRPTSIRSTYSRLRSSASTESLDTMELDLSSVPLLQHPAEPDENGVIPGENEYDDESFELPGVLEAEIGDDLSSKPLSYSALPSINLKPSKPIDIPKRQTLPPLNAKKCTANVSTSTSTTHASTSTPQSFAKPTYVSAGVSTHSALEGLRPDVDSSDIHEDDDDLHDVSSARQKTTALVRSLLDAIRPNALNSGGMSEARRLERESLAAMIAPLAGGFEGDTSSLGKIAKVEKKDITGPIFLPSADPSPGIVQPTDEAQPAAPKKKKKNKGKKKKKSKKKKKKASASADAPSSADASENENHANPDDDEDDEEGYEPPVTSPSRKDSEVTLIDTEVLGMIGGHEGPSSNDADSHAHGSLKLLSSVALSEKSAHATASKIQGSSAFNNTPVTTIYRSEINQNSTSSIPILKPSPGKDADYTTKRLMSKLSSNGANMSRSSSSLIGGVSVLPGIKEDELEEDMKDLQAGLMLGIDPARKLRWGDEVDGGDDDMFAAVAAEKVEIVVEVEPTKVEKVEMVVKQEGPRKIPEWQRLVFAAQVPSLMYADLMDEVVRKLGYVLHHVIRKPVISIGSSGYPQYANSRRFPPTPSNPNAASLHVTIRKTESSTPLVPDGLAHLNNFIKRRIGNSSSINSSTSSSSSSSSSNVSFVEAFSDRPNSFYEDFVDPRMQQKSSQRIIKSELQGTYYCDPDANIPQVVCIAARGGFGVSLLRRITSTPDEFDLIGLQFLPCLTEDQAKIVVPYPVGHPKCAPAIAELMSDHRNHESNDDEEEPEKGVWILVVRKVNAYQEVDALVSSFLDSFSSLTTPSKSATGTFNGLNTEDRLRLSILPSRNIEMCYATLTAFFRDSDLSIPENATSLPPLPSTKDDASKSTDTSIPSFPINSIPKSHIAPPRGILVSVLVKLFDPSAPPPSTKSTEPTGVVPGAAPKRKPQQSAPPAPPSLQRRLSELLSTLTASGENMVTGMKVLRLNQGGLAAKLVEGPPPENGRTTPDLGTGSMTLNDAAKKSFLNFCTEGMLLSLAVWTTHPERLGTALKKCTRLSSASASGEGRKSGVGFSSGNASKDSSTSFRGLLGTGSDIYIAPSVQISRWQISTLYTTGLPVDVRYSPAQLGQFVRRLVPKYFSEVPPVSRQAVLIPTHTSNLPLSSSPSSSTSTTSGFTWTSGARASRKPFIQPSYAILTSPYPTMESNIEAWCKILDSIPVSSATVIGLRYLTFSEKLARRVGESKVEMSGEVDEVDEMIAKVFRRADSGHKGFLNRHDLKVAMMGLFGYTPSKV
ncbi:hypothetical protein HDV05_000011 [Chytridiales sp. JEL 0842]|nr:hypothetical protein HDV05_000011 [Chytridiales sp. JEL 0842]